MQRYEQYDNGNMQCASGIGKLLEQVLFFFNNTCILFQVVVAVHILQHSWYFLEKSLVY